MLYIISNLCNPERLNNCLKDIQKFFPTETVTVCFGVDKHSIKVWNNKITIEGSHFGDIDERDIPTNDIEPYHLGCVMSHINVLHDAIKNWYENIIVCEDDLLLSANLDRYIKWYMDTRPDDRELLRLSRHPFTAGGVDMEKVNSHWNKWSAWWCEMYMLNKAWIKKLYNLFKNEFIASVDWMMLHAADSINIYITNRSWWIQWNNWYMDKSDRDWLNKKRQYDFWFKVAPDKARSTFKSSIKY